MTARDFAFWLKGYFDLSGPGKPISAERADVIRRHLAAVFADSHGPEPTPAPTEWHDGHGPARVGPAEADLFTA